MLRSHFTPHSQTLAISTFFYITHENCTHNTNIQSYHINPHLRLFLIFFFETDRDPLLLPLSFFSPCSAPIPFSYFLDLWDPIPGMSPALTLPSTADNDNNGAAKRRYKGHECSALDV